MREAISLPRLLIERLFDKRRMTAVRSHFSAAALRAAWQARRLLTRQQAIAAAEAAIRSKMQPTKDWVHQHYR